jgi:hypothetical protein
VGDRGRRPDAIAIVCPHLEHDPSGIGDAPLDDGRERMWLDVDDVCDRSSGGVRAARRQRGYGYEREQEKYSGAPQHGINVGTLQGAACPSNEGRLARDVSPKDTSGV